MNYFVPHFTGHAITYPCWYQSEPILVKWPPNVFPDRYICIMCLHIAVNGFCLDEQHERTLGLKAKFFSTFCFIRVKYCWVCCINPCIYKLYHFCYFILENFISCEIYIQVCDWNLRYDLWPTTRRMWCGQPVHQWRHMLFRQWCSELYMSHRQVEYSPSDMLMADFGEIDILGRIHVIFVHSLAHSILIEVTTLLPR